MLSQLRTFGFIALLCASGACFSSAAIAENVPPLVGKMRGDAISTLLDMGFNYSVRFVERCMLKDVVVSVDPPEGTQLGGPGSMVILDVNLIDGVEIPDVREAKLSDAVKRFEELGLRLVDRVKPWIEQVDWCSRFEYDKVRDEIRDLIPQNGLVVCRGQTVTAVRLAEGRWVSERYPNGECK